MHVSPFVDFDAIALATEGFSGADLQALVYNSHLEAVHASLRVAPRNEKRKESVPDDNDNIIYTIVGGPLSNSVQSKAEENALQKKVRAGRTVDD